MNRYSDILPCSIEGCGKTFDQSAEANSDRLSYWFCAEHKPNLEQLGDTMQERQKLEHVRELCQLAIELGIARLKVGEIEIQPAPFALRPRAAETSAPRPRSSEPIEGENDEDGDAPPRRPLVRGSSPEPQPHPLAYFSSKASS